MGWDGIERAFNLFVCLFLAGRLVEFRCWRLGTGFCMPLGFPLVRMSDMHERVKQYVFSDFSLLLLCP